MNKHIIILCLGLFFAHTLSYAQQSFQNVTSSMGINGQYGLGHGVGWGDIDNDGDPDLGLSNQEGDGFWFYQNNGNTFANITASGGLSGLGGNKIIIAEVTGDDYNDLLLRTRSGTQYLFESNGDGTFNNITSSAGIYSASIYNIADFDNDGYTDLLSVANDNFSILYNNGNATFQPAQIISPYESFWGVTTATAHLLMSLHQPAPAAITIPGPLHSLTTITTAGSIFSHPITTFILTPTPCCEIMVIIHLLKLRSHLGYPENSLVTISARAGPITILMVPWTFSLPGISTNTACSRIPIARAHF